MVKGLIAGQVWTKGEHVCAGSICRVGCGGRGPSLHMGPGCGWRAGGSSARKTWGLHLAEAPQFPQGTYGGWLRLDAGGHRLSWLKCLSASCHWTPGCLSWPDSRWRWLPLPGPLLLPPPGSLQTPASCIPGAPATLTLTRC